MAISVHLLGTTSKWQEDFKRFRTSYESTLKGYLFNVLFVRERENKEKELSPVTWEGTRRNKALDDIFKLTILMCRQVYGEAPLLYYFSVCLAKENFPAIQWTRWVTWETWERSYVCHLILILLSVKFTYKLYIKLKLALGFLAFSFAFSYMEEAWSPH